MVEIDFVNPDSNLQGEGDADGEDEGNMESTGDDGDASKKSEESSDGDASEEEAGNTEGENSEGKGDDGLPPNGPSAGDLQEDEGGQEENAESADQRSESTDEGTESEAPQENTEVAGPELPGGAVPVPAGPPVGSQDGLNIDDLGSRPDMRVRELDEELSKILRRELARVPANNAMATALTEAAGDIGDYGSDLNAHESTKEGPVEEREPMPDPIDLDDIARDYKLQLQETELMNYDQLRLEPIGQLGVTIQRMYYGQPFQDRIAMAEYLFGNYYQLDEWVPETVVEYGTNN